MKRSRLACTVRSLFQGLPVEIRGNPHLSITGMSAHSGSVVPGGLFIARQGSQLDGMAFIPEAIRSGAAAIVTEVYHPSFRSITQIVTSNSRSIEPILADRYYRSPTKKLYLIGITGTNGKTSTAYLVRHLLSSSKRSCGLIGTIEYRVGKRTIPATLTTPGILENQALFREMVDDGMQEAVMEVTSHALSQGRTDRLSIDLGIFTNLSRDHLDYHQTMTEYMKAKRKLFASLEEGKIALLNKEDPVHQQIAKGTKAEQITYGMKEGSDLFGKISFQSHERIDLIVSFRGQSFAVSAPLFGEINASNLLSAIGVALLKGVDIVTIQERVRTLPQIPGRMERVCSKMPFSIFVDFAHTPEALKVTLAACKKRCQGRLIVLFGAGGNRDAGKRPLMGRAVEEFADVVVVTSDNPRFEDPKEIIRDICKGIVDRGKTIVESDRRRAIRMALEVARKGDFVVVAGRGHELTQSIGGKSIPFNDRKVIEEELEILTREVDGV